MTDCTDVGRVTRCYVSAYQRDRVHNSRLIRGESRCLVAEFNGAIGPARTITSVTWRCQWPMYAIMSNARVQSSGRSVAVDILANWPGRAWLKCEATLDNGEVYTQLFHIAIADAAWFAEEQATAQGPTSLTATA